ncbi:MAG: hypothetical protein MJE66_16695, partial [Proteobacteria bacterium]|nr:hypothetical protein [Pseudomonadota bacterium]
SQAAAFIATSLGAPGPEVNGLVTWLGIDEPLPPSVLPDNGPAPTTLPGGVWGVETEPTDVDRLFRTFYAGDTNFVEWYYPSSGLGVTAGAGGLDTTALSADPPLGRGRRDIANLTEAQNIDVPVIAFGGSNGLTPIPAAFLAFAETLAPCAAPSCDGSTPRVVDASNPNPAFPTYGGVAGGYEVHMSVGYSHVDVLTARDQPGNNVVAPLVDFLVRNLQ